jgi:hypothetical protein
MGLSCMAAWAANHITDDIMAILPQGINQNFTIAVVESIWIAAQPQGAGLAVFEAMACQQAYSNAFFVKCLSIQKVMGTKPNGHLTLSAKLAWLALNLKMLSYNIAQAGSIPKDASQVRPGMFTDKFDASRITNYRSLFLYAGYHPMGFRHLGFYPPGYL